MQAQLTLGPLLFHWPVARRLDLYRLIADEAPVDCVYLGEVVCAKRSPFFAAHLPQVIERLERAGKRVVLSTLAHVATRHERHEVASVCALADSHLVEANDATALYHLAQRRHAVGPYVNVYNEDTLAVLARRGATHVTLPPELPAAVIAALGAAAATLGVTLEVQVHGRVPLALSARCYHARAHGRSKDSCGFVCDQDADGLALNTFDGKPFLSVNGIQTLSHTCLGLLGELEPLMRDGVHAFRLSPHGGDTLAVANLYRRVLDGRLEAADARAQLAALAPAAPLANGFYHRRAGREWVGATA